MTSAADLLAAAGKAGQSGREETTYRRIAEATDRLLPDGYRTESHVSDGHGSPDLSIVTAVGAKAANIEVKLPGTLADAFRVGDDGEHQIGRYRRSGVPVLLTDGLRWHDVTDSDDVTVPVADFGDGCDPVAAEQQLRGLLHQACGTRPVFTDRSAVDAMAAVIAQIDAAVADDLTGAWATVRSALGFGGGASLDAGEGSVGEIVAFTLLSIAAHLDPLPDDTFAAEASAEWAQEGRWGDSSRLPSVMGAALDQFRLHLPARTALGMSGWPTVRALAAHLADTGDDSDSNRWERLSGLWDDWLARAGRRKALGSWQTPPAVAKFQARQVDEALKRLGYEKGLGDPAAIIVDPCVGTGVYLQAVIDQADCPAGAFNVDGPGDHPRLIGADVSPTAVAATHIRTSSSGVTPLLYMTDTLLTSGQGDQCPLIDPDQHDLSMVIAAVHRDWRDMNRWASRDGGRDPIIAVIGNPPYLRAGLDQERYAGVGWYEDVFNGWRKGSGGRGALNDLFVGFWAWALNVCRQTHDDLPGNTEDESGLCGVVSFITNRAWIETSSFGPMRRWVRQRAALIEVVDFGPGSRGGGAGRWSQDQPFDIQTGTVIVTILFNPHSHNRMLNYQRATWCADTQQMALFGPVCREIGFRIEDDDVTAAIVRQTADAPWTLHIKSAMRGLLHGITTTNGVVTADDDQWISVTATKKKNVVHAYRSLDNRYSPTDVPPKSQLRAGAGWREKALFAPHREHQASGGWYAILHAVAAKPGPAIHATRHLPDHHLLTGGRVVRVGPGVNVPADYRLWAAGDGRILTDDAPAELALSNTDFWLYALAAAHHPDYWTEGTARAETLAHKTTEIPLTDDPAVIAELLGIGRRLVDVWSLEAVEPCMHDSDGAGGWRFDYLPCLESVRVNGYAVLSRWRKARRLSADKKTADTAGWDADTAGQYAEVVAALKEMLALSDAVGRLIPGETRTL